MAEAVTVGYGREPVVSGVDLAIAPGRVTAVIGPNGCGKSTLLRTLARLLRPTSGRVLLNGRPIEQQSTRQVARQLALLPQSPTAPEGLLVRDLVARGRHPHQSWYAQWSTLDEDIIERSLAQTGTSELADRRIDQLSGGQRQRVWIAMTLAQDTELILLDEPTTYLDLAHQVEVLELVHRLNADRGRTVIMVLHDLNLAVRYADEIVVMQAGRVAAQGGPHEVITQQLLNDVFGLAADVVADPRTGLPLIIPHGHAAQLARTGAPPNVVGLR